MKLSTQSTIMNNLTVNQSVVNSINSVCHIFIGNYNISSLSCYNGFLNGNFETKVRQNDVKYQIYQNCQYEPNKNGETFHYGLIRGIIPWMTQSRYHYGDLGIFCQLFHFILKLKVSDKKKCVGGSKSLC